jgi:glycosyltransferase involved in cell wall biosynthesis
LLEGSKNPDVSIIIPTLNEEKAIGKVLKSIPFGNLPPTEVVVVDGISKDKTVTIARNLGAYTYVDPEPGYGQAIQTGLKYTKGKIIVGIDGDATYDAEDLPKLVKPILEGKTNYVIGSRLAGEIHLGSMPLLNRIGNFVLTLIFNLLYHQKISDTQSGLWAIRKDVLEDLEVQEKGFGFITCMETKFAKKGYKISEIPSSYFQRADGTKPKLDPLKDGLVILLVIIKERFT